MADYYNGSRQDDEQGGRRQITRSVGPAVQAVPVQSHRRVVPFQQEGRKREFPLDQDYRPLTSSPDAQTSLLERNSTSGHQKLCRPWVDERPSGFDPGEGHSRSSTTEVQSSGVGEACHSPLNNSTDDPECLDQYLNQCLESIIDVDFWNRQDDHKESVPVQPIPIRNVKSGMGIGKPDYLFDVASRNPDTSGMLAAGEGQAHMSLVHAASVILHWMQLNPMDWRQTMDIPMAAMTVAVTKAFAEGTRRRRALRRLSRLMQGSEEQVSD